MSDERSNSEPAESATDGRDSDLERRDYMRAMGSVGLASALGGLGALGASSSVAAETADRSKTVDERIEEHRTGGLEVVVENSDGSTVENATVSVTQQSHDFRWGTAVDAGRLINQTGPGDNYREYIPDLFNTAVLENQHKWSFWEDDRQLADDATNWLLDQGLDVRGHVCIWGATQHGAVPSDVEDAMDSGDAQTIIDRSMQHIEDIITYYGDDIHEWEIVNEVFHEPDIIEAVEGEDVDPVTSDILADWYQHAESVSPGKSIAVNDYNTLEGLYQDEIEDYERQIQYLLDQGIDLDTIGLQCHFNDGEDLSHDEIMEQLNSYGQFGPSIKITEFDMADDSWSDSAKADFFETMLRATFSHPGVDAFIMWGFWDGDHWRDDAPLFYDDWSEKPAYDVFTGHVYGEWWTDETGATDGSGTYVTNAFLGEHEITVETDSDSATTSVYVDDSAGTTTVTVTVDGSGTDDGDDDDSSGSLSDGTYSIQNVNSGKGLDVVNESTDDGANVQQYEYWGGSNQQWNVEDTGDGYRIENVNSGKVLDVAGQSTDDGANVQQYSDGGSDNQRFYLTDQGSGQYRIQPVHSGKALEVENGSTEDGANVQQYDWHGGEAQLWTFDSV